MIQKKLILFFCLLLSICCACKNDKAVQTPDSDQQIETPATDSAKTDTTGSFQEIVSDMESEDRVIWQKPDLVLSLLGDLEGKTVADIGAGTGYFSFRLANKGAKVLAIDIDPRAISWINDQKALYPEIVQQNLEARLASEMDANLNPAEVDLVLMVNTYTYISDRKAYFERLKTGLKNGTKLVIIDFKEKATPIGPPVEDRLSMLQVEGELLDVGYSILNSDDKTLDYQYIVTARYLK